MTYQKIQTETMMQFNSPKRIEAKKIVWIIFVLLFIVYGVFNARNFLFGPSIEIIEPTGEILTQEALISIKGFAKNTSFLKLNDRSIYTDKEGYFSEKLLLSRGYNIIEIKGKDRFKNETKREFRVYYVDNS